MNKCCASFCCQRLLVDRALCSSGFLCVASYSPKDTSSSWYMMPVVIFIQCTNPVRLSVLPISLPLPPHFRLFLGAWLILPPVFLLLLLNLKFLFLCLMNVLLSPWNISSYDLFMISYNYQNSVQFLSLNLNIFCSWSSALSLCPLWPYHSLFCIPMCILITPLLSFLVCIH